MGQAQTLFDVIEQRSIVNFLVKRWIDNCIKQRIDPRKNYRRVVVESEDEARRFNSLAEVKAFYATPKQHAHCHQHYSVYDRPRGAYL